jgi:hypothetical protein
MAMGRPARQRAAVTYSEKDIWSGIDAAAKIKKAGVDVGKVVLNATNAAAFASDKENLPNLQFVSSAQSSKPSKRKAEKQEDANDSSPKAQPKKQKAKNVKKDTPPLRAEFFGKPSKKSPLLERAPVASEPKLSPARFIDLDDDEETIKETIKPIPKPVTKPSKPVGKVSESTLHLVISDRSCEFAAHGNAHVQVMPVPDEEINPSADGKHAAAFI